MKSSNFIGKHKLELDTPCLVIDKTKLLANLDLMNRLAQAKQVQVRPHAKTHKCTQIAKLQIEHGAVGICVAKVSEAYQMAAAGIKGILITSPIVSKAKIAKLIEVLKLAPDTMLVVDNYANAEQLSDAGSLAKLTLRVLIDIDAGISRTGIPFSQAVDLALKVNQLPNLKLEGIQCYAGHLQHIAELNLRREASHEVLKKAAKIKEELLAEGLDCQIQTGSGTGTFSIDAEIDSVSEIQPGSYCVMDQEYAVIEYKDEKFLPAMSLLTTVISANHRSHVTVDAGTKALYKVATKPKVMSHQNLLYDWDYFGDEHGKVSALNGSSLPSLGEVLEIQVAHCDPTINLFDCFYITENDRVIDCWDIDLRGCCQ